nr:male accessory gland serine protease inhibitor isoform X2 [Drosophila virilis]
MKLILIFSLIATVFVLFLILFLFLLTGNSVGPKNACHLPHSVDGYKDGTVCGRMRENWSYDSVTKTCIMFIYGGCGGNDNNFNTFKECKDTCLS